MKTLRPISQAVHSSSRLQRRITPLNRYIRPSNHQRQHQRTFITSPFTSSEPQQLTASRTLRYPSKAIYSVISDVASYHHFIPYCQSSTITRTSAPTEQDGKTYPEEARLVVGFNESVSEEFVSRVYCVPERIVEAVSGNAETSLSPEEIKHHSTRSKEADDPSRSNTVLSYLLTRWTLKPYVYKPPPTSALSKNSTHKNHEETSEIPGQEKTEVNLQIQYQFANPVYAALSQAATPKVAEKVIEAFEKRVKEVVEGPGHTR
jgi:coenzyme Q-binding protein COQ10